MSGLGKRPNKRWRDEIEDDVGKTKSEAGLIKIIMWEKPFV